MQEFKEFPKIYRVSRPCVITEKIDGTNASIFISKNSEPIELNYRKVPFLCASRTQWIFPENDNARFAKWAYEHVEELLRLGPGHHFGEWWGQKIQRGYNLKEKRFSLFNASRWLDDSLRPPCCHVVPVLYEGIFTTQAVDDCIAKLRETGSIASPGFMRPEGVVCFHVQGNFSLKKTLEKDTEHKGAQQQIPQNGTAINKPILPLETAT